MPEWDFATSGASLTSTGPSRGVRAMQTASDRIGKGLGELDDLLIRLWEQLDPVICPAPTDTIQGAATELAAVAAISPHTQELQKHSLRISTLSQRVSALLDRLDV